MGLPHTKDSFCHKGQGLKKPVVIAWLRLATQGLGYLAKVKDLRIGAYLREEDGLAGFDSIGARSFGGFLPPSVMLSHHGGIILQISQLPISSVSARTTSQARERLTHRLQGKLHVRICNKWFSTCPSSFGGHRVWHVEKLCEHQICVKHFCAFCMGLYANRGLLIYIL